MAQITMYPAFINSVETTTTNSISDTDTIIYVLADIAIPNAPNLLVLGTGASAETVLMTDKTGNMLTVIRGVQGSAKPWPNSTIIARNYTAYDHDTFKANIEDNATQLAQKKKHARFIKTVNQAIPNATQTQLLFENKISNNLEDFTTLEGGRIKILEEGIYQIVCGVVFPNNPTGVRWLSSDSLVVNQSAVNGMGTYLSICFFKEYQINEFIDLKVFQSSGGSLDAALASFGLTIRQVAEL